MLLLCRKRQQPKGGKYYHLALVLDKVVDGVGRLDFKGDGLAGQRLHEDLQTEKGVLKLLASKDAASLYAMRSNTTLMPDGLFFTLFVSLSMMMVHYCFQ